VTYIRTTPEKLWSALTDDVQFMKQYCSALTAKASDRISWKHSPATSDPRRRRDRRGRAARRLLIRWQNQHKPELKAEGESQCTIELEPSGTAVKLSITTRSSANPRSSSRRVRRLAEGDLQPEVPAGDSSTVLQDRTDGHQR